jgi:Sec-independent protein translocase protein TatA
VLIIGAAALIFFGPDQLPKVARRVGRVVRDVQMTSQAFVREMERAADEADFAEHRAASPSEVRAAPPDGNEAEPSAEPPERKA